MVIHSFTDNNLLQDDINPKDQDDCENESNDEDDDDLVIS